MSTSKCCKFYCPCRNFILKLRDNLQNKGFVTFQRSFLRKNFKNIKYKEKMNDNNNEFKSFKELAKKNRLIFSRHFSYVRKDERNITNEGVKRTIINGLIFEDDDAYKSVCKIENKYITVVFHLTPRNYLFIRTAYHPEHNSRDVDSYKRWLKQGKR